MAKAGKDEEMNGAINSVIYGLVNAAFSTEVSE